MSQRKFLKIYNFQGSFYAFLICQTASTHTQTYMDKQSHNYIHLYRFVFFVGRTGAGDHDENPAAPLRDVRVRRIVEIYPGLDHGV